MNRLSGCALLAFMSLCSPILAVEPTAEELREIKSRITQLESEITALKAAHANDELVADAECGLQAVKNLVRFPEEFFDDRVAGRAISILGDGLRRAEQIRAGTAAWDKLSGRVQRGTRSKIDGTAQPYRVMLPASYDGSKPLPLVIYLHGRGDTDLGLGWVGGSDQQGGGGRGGGGGAEVITLQCFGRANNSFRYAGEEDVLLAIDAVCRNYNVDRDRIVMSGFSMGGAGSYQIGLHSPDMFCALQVNAGVIGNRTNLDGLSAVDRAGASLYGIMVDHAINLADVPYVGFAGENDRQLQASISIRDKLIEEGMMFEQVDQFHWRGVGNDKFFVVNPGAGHAHPRGDVKQTIDDYTSQAIARGRVVPDRVRYVTYNTRYNRSYWVTVDGLEQHYSRAFVDATRNADHTELAVTTTNISRLTLRDTQNLKLLKIDGQTISVPAGESVSLAKGNGDWKNAADVPVTGLVKRHGLQGPIDDAFMDAFLCVTPTGTPWNEIADAHGDSELKWFSESFAKVFRGEVRQKPDAGITDEDIAQHNLVLFGDPGSNAVLARIIDKLPIQWSKSEIKVGDLTYSAADHVPVLISPNPLNPERYVVLNIGQSGELRGRGSPSYGDVAVLKVNRTASGEVSHEVIHANVFNESWQLP